MENYYQFFYKENILVLHFVLFAGGGEVQSGVATGGTIPEEDISTTVIKGNWLPVNRFLLDL